MKKILIGFGIALQMFVTANRISAAELRQETLQAWNDYIQDAQANVEARLNTGRSFLWVDEQPDRLLHARRGQIQVAPMNGRGSTNVPNGLIHHWIGAAFIPDASLSEVLDVIRDYSRYKYVYNPSVTDSHLIEKSAEDDRFSVRWVSKVLFVSAAMDTRCSGHFVHLNPQRAYSSSHTTHVQEIQNYGQAGEAKLPPDQGDGYMWRMFSFARYEQRDGGVYLEIEAIALTRDIPGPLAVFITPVVRKLSRNSLLISLRQTRDAVGSKPELKSSLNAEKPADRASTVIDLSKGFRR